MSSNFFSNWPFAFCDSACHSPFRRGVLPLLIVSFFGFCVEAKAQDWWQQASESRTRYYNLKTDLPEDEAAEIANHLDLTFESYRNLFAGLKLKRIARLDVYIFAEQKDYIAILKKRFNDDGTGSGGKCITRGNVISLVAWKGRQSMDRLKRVMQHEGFHQFASNFFTRLPTWANEGLAEVFERGVLVGKEIVLGEVSPGDVRRLNAFKEKGRFTSLGTILTVPQSEWNQQVVSGTAGPNYLQAWNVCHCFLFSEDSRYQQQFLQFLKGINDGNKWQDSFVRAFGVPDFDSMNEIWLKYISKLSPTDYRQTIRRMEYLSMAYMKARQTDPNIRNFDQLKDWILENGFEFSSTLFGKELQMSGEDPKVFTVPFAQISTTKPVFEMVDSKGRKPNESKPVRKSQPLSIRTTGLKPLDFVMTWKKDRSLEHGFRPVFSLSNPN